MINICSCQSDIDINNQSILYSGIFNIDQQWSQETKGFPREVFVKVPSNGLKKYPVLIVLHGNGGKASSFIDDFNYLKEHIIIAPQGYLRSWNIKKERSKAPDVNFILRIIEYIKKFDNIDYQNISILGSSNGSALVNQLIIELDEPFFKKAICIASQLNSYQYNNNKFWSQSNNFFNIPVIPKKGRKILCLAGSEDDVAIYGGGEGVLGYFFLHAEESAFLLAKAMGFKGNRIIIDLAEENPTNFFKYSYMDDHVIHYRIEGAGHGFDLSSEHSKVIIKNFIEN